ncbi:MAG TPA: hypothetical protein VFP01_11340 [Propionibacteriaceae bacterium]|nr:hypothetical protein [Propionibacteriaceae bacterium]
MALLTVPNSWGLHEHGTPGDPDYPHPKGGKAVSGTLEKPGGGKITVEVEEPASQAALKGVFGDADPDEVLARLARQFDGDVTISMAVGAQTGALGIKIKDAAGNVLTQQFKRQSDGTLTAVIPYFFVEKPGRDRGLAKRVLRDTMQVYDRLGVTKVQLEANIDVGGYAWAKFGWTTTDPDDFRAQVLVQLLGPRGRMIDKAERTAIIAFVNEHKGPKLPWHVAGLSINGKKFGKSLMLGTSWQAEFSLADMEARDRFHAYVGG